ncbi:CCHC-type domain-containing protein, partial [Trichonephila inaurata madagascariensis]
DVFQSSFLILSDILKKGGINIPEDEKISHLMKGMDEDLYQVLINSEVSTVDKFVACCPEVDVMKKKQVVPLRYEMLPNVSPISTANEEHLSDLIRRIVKEEIEKVFPRITTCINDGPRDLESIIREVRRPHSLEKNLHLLLTELKDWRKFLGTKAKTSTRKKINSTRYQKED